MSKITEQPDSPLPREGRALLAKLFAEKAQKPKTARLSFAQQRLWFIHQLDPSSSAWNMAVAVRLTGTLDMIALWQSLNEIIRRHETLRTIFAVADGQPVQVIVPALIIPLPMLDLRDLPEGQREGQARRLVNEEAMRPFDLARSPLFRAQLFQLGEQEHILLLNVHHIVSDGWSQEVLLREVTQLYPAFANGQPSPLPELSIQYASFVEWQRQLQQTQELEKGLAYWKQQLAAPLPVLGLASHGLLSEAGTPELARETIIFPSSLNEALKSFCRQHQVTLFVALLAAIKTLLYRYTGQTDLIVGSPIANRDRADLENMIGLFINSLVLRTDLSGDPPFLELLSRVRKTVLEAFAHKAVPFEQLVEMLRPGRDLSRNPLFQVVFIWQGEQNLYLESQGLKLGPFPVDLKVETTDVLGVVAKETEEGLTVILEYSPDILNENIASHLRMLLEGIVADPQRRLSALPLLTGAERRRLLVSWNDTETSYPKDQCVHQLFEAQVERTPDAIAVTCGDRQLTYRRLNSRANQLARCLQKLGIGSQTLVGLCAGRSLEMIVGILGILKAGGAYAPLDPAYPPERLAFMVEDAHIPVLLTQGHLVDRLPGSRQRVICLDKDWETIAQERDENLVGSATPQDLMYVIYTSGSTGRPKGAGVYQQSFVSLLNWFVKDFDLAAGDSTLLISSFSFDLTQKNFYAPLWIGGTLHFSPSERYDPDQILGAIEDRQVTWVNCTPSAFYPLVKPDDRGALLKLRSLRYVFLGGEPISVSRLWEWLRDASCKAQVVNTYGPTECTDICVSFRLEQPERFLEKAVPIGRPIYNAKVLILDENLGLSPAGMTGELCVAGQGVGWGYVNDLELTSVKFVPNPYGGGPGERLYRTGDLARYSRDGHIEFLGRMDAQVKIRGFRIEPGGIEAALEQHPLVREAVVIAWDREHEPDDKRLVAYVVPEGEEPAVGDLRRFLQEKLPGYMVPSTFVLLEALPLTPNGKLDRRALPAPDASESGGADKFVAPETPVEETLAEIWKQVLQIERVGIYDNFFDLGGHSLLATQIIYRVNRAFDLSLPVYSLFEEQTISGLALLIEETLLEEVKEESGEQARSTDAQDASEE